MSIFMRFYHTIQAIPAALTLQTWGVEAVWFCLVCVWPRQLFAGDKRPRRCPPTDCVSGPGVVGGYAFKDNKRDGIAQLGELLRIYGSDLANASSLIATTALPTPSATPPSPAPDGPGLCFRRRGGITWCRPYPARSCLVAPPP